MITVLMLESDDKVQPDDWCRPLVMTQNMFNDTESLESFGMYGSTPQNNVRWIKVRDAFGECWWGKPVSELNGMFSKMVNQSNQNLRYEFIRGSMPADHVWNWQAAKARRGL